MKNILGIILYLSTLCFSADIARDEVSLLVNEYEKQIEQKKHMLNNVYIVKVNKASIFSSDSEASKLENNLDRNSVIFVDNCDNKGWCSYFDKGERYFIKRFTLIKPAIINK